MPAVIAFMDDLMFLSRIQQAAKAEGLEVRRVVTVPDLLEACRSAPRVVLMDLDAVRLPWAEGITALRRDPGSAGIPVVGFYGHVHADRAHDAELAGATQVLPRGAFVRQLTRILGSGPASA
jgi:CheY-like chemotaxis protein